MTEPKWEPRFGEPGAVVADFGTIIEDMAQARGMDLAQLADATGLEESVVRGWTEGEGIVPRTIFPALDDHLEPTHGEKVRLGESFLEVVCVGRSDSPSASNVTEDD